MNIEILKEDLSEGSIELIRIIRENDRQNAFSMNFALEETFKYSISILTAIKNNDLNNLSNYLIPNKIPSDIILFIHSSLRYLNNIYDKKISENKSTFRQCDYIRFILQGLAATYVDCFPNRDSDTIFKLNIKEYFAKLSKIEQIDFWRFFLKNYIGEVLIYYFSDLQIRKNIPSLPYDTEINLRQIDAKRIADFTVSVCTSEVGEEIDFIHLLNSFRLIFTQI